MITRHYQRCLASSGDELIHAVLHAEGWVRSAGLLTPKAYRIIDQHVWAFVDAPLAPKTAQPCGWNWAALSASSRSGRAQIVRYLRDALRHHCLWTESRVESN